MARFFALFVLWLTSFVAGAQRPEVSVIKDLEADWKIYQDNRYVTVDKTSDHSTIYFLVEADLFKGASLRVESQKQFSVFVNGKLIDSKSSGIVLFDLDSLSRRYSSHLNFAIMRQAVQLSTLLVIPDSPSYQNDNLMIRKAHHFFDFSIMAAIILLIFFVILLRSNPRLTFDYLNFIKLFSLQEREESSMTTRITSSINLLFYTFISLLTSFLLMIIFHFAYADLSLANTFQVNSLQEGFYQWMKLASLILLTLFGKLVLVSLFSNLYKTTEITALQFFNFVRLFFFTFGIISLLMIIFFVGKVLDPEWYYNLFFVAIFLFIFWEVIIFLKLMSRVPFRIFHLFFYLCASELIPLVILIKVVFY